MEEKNQEYRKIRIKNFRSIVIDNFIEIKPITLFFGKNGSGKSSFIKAIKFLNQNLSPLTTGHTIYDLDHDIDLGNFKEIAFQQNTDKKIEIDYEEFRDNINYRLRTTFGFAKNGQNFISLKIDDLINNITFEVNPHKKNVYEKEFVKNVIMNYGRNDLLLSERLIKSWDAHNKRDDGSSYYPSNAIDIKRSINLNIPNLVKYFSYLDILPFVSDNLQHSYYKKLEEAFNFSDDQKEVVRDMIKLFVKDIPFFTKRFFNHFYVTPVRERPLSKYKLFHNKFSESDYYSILTLIDKLKNDADIHMPYDDPFPNILSFIKENLKKFGLGVDIIISKENGYGSLYIKDMQGVKNNISESSSGLIHLLPIIANSYYAFYTYEQQFDLRHLPYDNRFTDTLFIEQPELHLHPALQTQLIEFISNGHGTYLIETHSEHIVRKLQVLIAKGELAQDRVAVYYFDKDEKSGITSIKEMELEDNGFFKEPWPDGFFDDSFNLSMELLSAKRN